MAFFCAGLRFDAGHDAPAGRRARILTVIAALVIVVSAGIAAPADAAVSERAFKKWVAKLWPQARRRGVSKTTFDRAFRGVTPDPDVIRAANYQPEFVKEVWEYLHGAVSDWRIDTGKQMLLKHARILDAMETIYGVDRHILMAIWGLETRYGTFTGKKYVIRSLATLGVRGRRKKFGRSQLLAALKILQRGDITPAKMKGSWAGAMGHTQFIPTTYRAFAVDFDGDGRRNIWGSVPDALGSAANYLRASGWRTGETWGYEVRLPKKFSTRLARRTRSIAWWKKRGVKRVRGKKFPRPKDRAKLLLPAGRKGPAFLVLKNFRAILRYNNSTSYALAVGHLADRLLGQGAFSRSWPWTYRPLKQAETIEMQKLLNVNGYAIGDADGVVGTKTRAALREYQKKKGLSVNGKPSFKVLKALRNDG